MYKTPGLRRCAGVTAACAMFVFFAAGLYGQPKKLSSNTRFFIPAPSTGAVSQVGSLLKEGKIRDALLIARMEMIPQAVWLSGGTSTETAAMVKKTLIESRRQRAVPVLVLYNIPGRDCGSYSAGGAQNTADYEAWIDAVAGAIGKDKAVILLEPDSLANLPSDCGYPSTVDATQLTADRYTQINYAITKLEEGEQTLVYIDGGNSHWQAVGTMAERLVTAGLAKAQGFFSNVSNYNLNNYEAKFGTWVSECIAFANDPEEGGWRIGHYDWCASQYYSPDGAVNPDDIATWIYTDEWYQQNMGTAVGTMHFVIDSSRNGRGPLDTSVYAAPPYNQPAAVIQTLTGGSWCNPPGRGLGTQPTAATGTPLLDAYLWVKTPGQSDGTCDAQGGARAWNYADFTLPTWPTSAAGQEVFDPLWGLDDPAAGAWFPQQALDLAKRANPKLLSW